MKEKYILAKRCTSRLTVHTGTQRLKTKNKKWGALCSFVIEINEE